MGDGFSAFIGVLWSVIVVAAIGGVILMNTASVKTNAVNAGFMEFRGQYYSVRPAVLRADPVQ